MSLIASIETGGTKAFAAVAERENPHALIETCRITTTDDPDRTLGALADFLGEHHRYRRIEAIGVASFGPLETDPASPKYGWITTTPKPGWRDTDLNRAFAALDDVPVAFVTDVTGSLLGERWQGAAVGLDNLAYATIGTGIGVGVMVQGQLVTGHSTPELGHFLVRRHPADDYIGICPFHADCLEGLASGPAVLQRWGRPAASPDELDILSHYIAQLAVVTTLSVAPQRIVIGGGVMKTEGLWPAVREQAALLTNGYLGTDHPLQNPESDFVVPPDLGDWAGIHGGLELALGLL
ncbi:ROK family protein [Enemella sp. A6]|uniref:ROK family protein n=1 Tax=Enemella sp. A6 TaxID=3440152 RepID=UPI003EB6FBF0